MNRFFALVALVILLTGCQSGSDGYKMKIIGFEVLEVTPSTPAAPAPAAPATHLIRKYPERDLKDGCVYIVSEMSDGTFPKEMFDCSDPKPAQPIPAPATPAVQARQVAVPVTKISATQSACPISPAQAATLAGGNAGSWSLLPGSEGTGWHYEGAETTLTAPMFGKLDAPSGTFRNGQTTKTIIATFWCNG